MFEDLLNQLLALAGTNLLNLLSALGILIVGWIVARLIAWGVFRLLKRTNLDNRLAGAIEGEEEDKEKHPRINMERWISNAVFYLLRECRINCVFGLSSRNQNERKIHDPQEEYHRPRQTK